MIPAPKNFFKSDFFNVMMLLAIACIAFWQITFSQNMMHHDIMNISLPWRYFVGESLRFGFLPLWNPYQEMGWSQHTDPQTWYAPAMISGWIFGYDVFVIHAEYILHIFVAGWGMYSLCRYYGLSGYSSFFSAVAYMLSGFMVGNAQHLGWIVSAAWIPWLIKEITGLFYQPRLKCALKSGVFAWLLFTGGYIVFDITIFYVLLIITPVFLTIKIIRRDKKKLIEFLKFGSLALIFFLLLAAPAIYSMLFNFSTFTRSQPLSVSEANFFSLRPEHLVSLVFPFVLTADMESWRIDVSMPHMFMGLFMIPGVMAGLIYSKRRIKWFWLTTGIFFLLTAMGQHFPLRTFLYHNLPFFDSFRFPPLFRYFFILSFCIIGAFGLEELIRKKKLRIWAFGALSIILVVSTIIFIANFSSLNSAISRFSISAIRFLKEPEMHEAWALQTLDYIIISFSALMFLIVFRKSGNLSKVVLMVFHITTIVGAVQWVMYATAIGFDRPGIVMKQCGDQWHPGFRVRELKKMKELSHEKRSCGPLWRNYTIFTNETAPDGYSPYNYRTTWEFNFSSIRDIVLENKLVYFPRTGIRLDEVANVDLLDSSVVFLTGNEIEPFETINENVAVEIKRVDPSGVRMKVETENETWMVLQQNFQDGCKIYVDGIEAKVYPVNICQMMTKIPAGKHFVQFKYSIPYINLLFCISMGTLVLVVLAFFVLKVWGRYFAANAR